MYNKPRTTEVYKETSPTEFRSAYISLDNSQATVTPEKPTNAVMIENQGPNSISAYFGSLINDSCRVLDNGDILEADIKVTSIIVESAASADCKVDYTYYN